MSKLAQREKNASTFDVSELLKLLTNFGEIEVEDITIKAKRLVLKPLRQRR